MGQQNSSRLPGDKKIYQSYLLRLWRTEESDTGSWRASLEDLNTGGRLGFANLEELFAFLMEQSQPGPRPGPPTEQLLSEGGTS